MRETAAPVTQNNVPLQVLSQHIHLLHFPFKRVHFFLLHKMILWACFATSLMLDQIYCLASLSVRTHHHLEALFSKDSSRNASRRSIKREKESSTCLQHSRSFPLLCSEGGREPLTVVWVEEVSVDVSRKGFLYSFHLFRFFFPTVII